LIENPKKLILNTFNLKKVLTKLQVLGSSPYKKSFAESTRKFREVKSIFLSPQSAILYIYKIIQKIALFDQLTNLISSKSYFINLQN